MPFVLFGLDSSWNFRTTMSKSKVLHRDQLWFGGMEYHDRRTCSARAQWSQHTYGESDHGQHTTSWDFDKDKNVWPSEMDTVMSMTVGRSYSTTGWVRRRDWLSKEFLKCSSTDKREIYWWTRQTQTHGMTWCSILVIKEYWRSRVRALRGQPRIRVDSGTHTLWKVTRCRSQFRRNVSTGD